MQAQDKDAPTPAQESLGTDLPADVAAAIAETLGLPDAEVAAWLSDAGVPPDADYRTPDKAGT